MNKQDKKDDVDTTGHVWDGVEELDNPMPRWWVWVFYLTIIWALPCLAADQWRDAGSVRLFDPWRSRRRHRPRECVKRGNSGAAGLGGPNGDPRGRGIAHLRSQCRRVHICGELFAVPRKWRGWRTGRRLSKPA